MSRREKIMAVAMIFSIVLMCVGFSGTVKAPEAVANPGPRVNQISSSDALNPDEVISHIMYIEDPRPHGSLCYAYLWGGYNTGGPALANVPCAAIPRELLVTAKVVR